MNLKHILFPVLFFLLLSFLYCGGGKFNRSYEKDRGENSGHYTIAGDRVSGLKAGYVDDNRQYNRFIAFLERYRKRVKNYSFAVQERIILKVKDKNGKPVFNASVKIKNKNKLLYAGKTYPDGTCYFYPAEHDGSVKRYTVYVSYNQQQHKAIINRRGKRTVTVRMNILRAEYARVPVDILFIFDTTGSMGEEIHRLKKTIDIIHMNLAAMKNGPRVRFGMVLYKDRTDDYVTKIVPFTSHLQKFKDELDEVRASGGGDYPEDLQAALRDSIKKMRWRKGAVKLGFIITDAEPHLDYGQKYTYRHAAYDARGRAIKIFTIGTGGLPLGGEYVLRQIAQYTGGNYIFLTYGEKGDSEGGKTGSVSHHVGANFSTDKLESVIIRFAKREISYVSANPLEKSESYFTASKVAAERKEETLKKLFNAALGQLLDYSTLRIKPGASTAVIPIITSTKKLKPHAEYFTSQLELAVQAKKTFAPVERKNIQKLAQELKLHSSGIVKPGNTSKLGNMLGAKLLIISTLYRKKTHYELFLKLVRVNTGEVLSVTKARIDFALEL